MAEEFKPSEGLSTAADRFPFVMLLTNIFLLGGIFLLLNGPLIAAVIENKKFTNTFSLISLGVVPLWKSVVQSSGGVFSGFLFFLLSLVLGLLLTPVDRAITFASVFVWWNLSKLWPLGKSASASKPFTSAAFTDPGCVGLLAWLMTKREAKLHWEWGLFNFYVYWGVFTNITICIGLALFLLWPSISLLEGLLYGAVGIMFSGFAVVHSKGMARVHKHYQEQYSLAMKTAKTSSPEADLSTPDVTAVAAPSKSKEASS